MVTVSNNKEIYVNITPYEHEGNKYDMLRVSITHRKGKGFYVCYIAGWKTSMGYGCMGVGDGTPLSSVQWLQINDAQRNSTKEQQRMMRNLQAFSDGIAWLFDHREFKKLNTAICNIAIYGYTDAYRKQMEKFMQTTTTNKTSEQTEVLKSTTESFTMKMYRTMKEKNPGTVLLFRCDCFYEAYDDDARKLSNILGLTVCQRDSVDAVGFPHTSLDHCLPKLIRAGIRVAIIDKLEGPTKGKEQQPVGKAKIAEQPTSIEQLTEVEQSKAVEPILNSQPSIPNSNTAMVKKTINNKNGKVQPTAKVENLQIVSNGLPDVRFATYTTKKGGTAPQIIGFSGEDDPRWKAIYDKKPKWVSAGWIYSDSKRVYRLIFGTRYIDVAKKLCEAYNIDDRQAWQAAEAECEECYHQAQAEGKARWEAIKAERKAKRTERKESIIATFAAEQSTEKFYTEQEVATLMQRVLAGDKAAIAEVNAMIKKVA